MDNGIYDPVERALEGSLEGRPAEARRDNLIAVVHRRLRGRYPLAAALAVAFMIPGAWMGYRAKRPEFRSTGLVHVAPALPVKLYRTHENERMPGYDTFLSTQASLIESRRVLDRAVEDPELRAVGWPAGAEGVKVLRGSLRVSHGRRDEIIVVTVGHTERAPAQRAVKAVINAYQDLFGEQGQLARNENIQALVERERRLATDLQSDRSMVTKLTEEYGPDMLVTPHAAKVEQIDTIDRQIAQVESSISQNEARAADESIDPSTLLDSIVAGDPRLADLRDRASQLESLIDVESRKYGPNHRRMKQLRGDLESVQAQTRARAEELVAATHDGMLDGGPKGAMPGFTSLAQMRGLRDRLLQQRSDVQAEAAAINAKRAQIATLTERIDETKERLAETRRRLDQIRVETDNADAGRISILQEGDLPVDPDDKRKVLAAGGAMFGACFGVGLVFLLGFLDRGYRYIDDLERTALSAPLLGTLPDLSSGTVESNEMAALSVHHLRNMLQLQSASSPDGAGRVYTVTSASSGDGKTSLTLALGMSFALSGQRTLLLDADLVGRGLTRELKLEKQPGLCQAIEAETLNGEVHTCKVANLSAMPAGMDGVIDAKHLSHTSLERIIRRLRADFDVVLIDTGPLLGSLEANLVAALSDGVVLTVSRGQSHRFVEACLARLDRMNAHCAGLVFNRADSRDFDRSVSGASFCSQSVRSKSPSEKELRGSNGRSQRGALVRAVVGPELDEAGATGKS